MTDALTTTSEVATDEFNPNSTSDKKRLPKEERIAIERNRLLAQLASKNLTTVKARVAYLLNLYPDTRNTDKALVYTYWRFFQSETLGADSRVTEDNILRLENHMNISRARQKIQNEYGLFQASEAVRAARRERETQFKETVIEDKPRSPLVEIYCDESGKNQDFLVVGSVWAYDSIRTGRLVLHLNEWKIEQGIRGEFHFNELKKRQVEAAKEFVAQALGRSDTFSFKAVAVNQKGVRRSIEQAVRAMYYQLVYTGLEHEFGSGRLAPPRIVQVIKDKEDGEDKLALTELRQHLAHGISEHFSERAKVDLVEAVDSAGNYVIQLADLFTGSVNRVLNPSEARNHKDEFAEYVLDLLGLRINPDGTVNSSKQDIGSVITLG